MLDKFSSNSVEFLLFFMIICSNNSVLRAAGTYLNMVRTYIFEIDPLAHLNPTSLCAMTYGIQCKTKKS